MEDQAVRRRVNRGPAPADRLQAQRLVGNLLPPPQITKSVSGPEITSSEGTSFAMV